MPRRRDDDDSGDFDRPLKTKIPVWTVVLFVAVPVLVAGVAAAGMFAVLWLRPVDRAAGQPLPVAPPPEVVAIQIGTLLGEKNEAKHAAAFKGKTCRFTVTFKAVEKHQDGRWLLIGDVDRETEPDVVMAVAGPDSVAVLNPADKVTVEGTYAGKFQQPRPPTQPGYNPFSGSGIKVTTIPMPWRGYAIYFTDGKVVR